jgi:hypothetical protein
MVLYGASVPVILSRLASSYWLVGECYIHGAMDGLKSTFHGSSGGSIIEAFANNTQGDGSPGITTNAVVIVSLR